MKKLLYLLAIALTAFGLAACNDKIEEPDAISVTGLTLDITSKAIEVGDEFTLTVTVSPENATDKSVTWKSSNNNIATVTDGVVKGIAEGNATITVTTTDGKHAAQCAVAVAAEVIPVTGLTLSETENRTIKKGSSFTVKAIVAPDNATNKNVTWAFDEKIISVVDDPADATQKLVTGLKDGTTTLTASSAAQDNNGAPFTASIDVTVETALTGIALAPTTISITEGGTAELRVSFEPADAKNKNFSIYFPSGTLNDNYATAAISAEDGNVLIITGKALGATSIYVKAQEKDAEGNDIVAICSIWVVQPVTGLALDKTSETIKVSGTLTLTPVFTPSNASNQTLTWTSSNSAIASVNNNGMVSGVAVGGPVTITATTTDGSDKTASCTIYVEAADVDHPFGVLEFKSTKTWEIANTSTWSGVSAIGTRIWSDYLTGSRCAGKATLDTSAENGDCAESTGKYHLFSMLGMTKYRHLICPEGWRAPSWAEYQALDLYFYPRTFTMGWSNQFGGSAKYVSDWGLVYGGYHDGTSLVGNDTETRIWTGEVPSANRLRYVRMQSTANSATEMGGQVIQTTFGMPVRCVKDAN